MNFTKYLIGKNEVSPDPRYLDFNRQLVPAGDVDQADVVLLGVPYDPGTPKHVGASQGPMGIRESLSFLRTYSCELDLDLMEYLKVCDIGNVDIDINDPVKTFSRVGTVLRSVYQLPKSPRVLVMGGDHSTAPQNVASFCNAHLKKTGLIWFDNHLDTMKDYHGDQWYCGCPLYRILTENANCIDPKNVAVIGPRGFHHSPQMWAVAKELGVHVFLAEDVRLNGIQSVIRRAMEFACNGVEKTYVSFDIDVADAAFAPGTQSPCPGGLLPSELTYAVRTLAMRGIDAMDLVEVAPPKDIDHRTCMLAASIALEFMAGCAWLKKRESEGDAEC